MNNVAINIRVQDFVILHFCDSVPVLVVCLVHFCFCFFLDSVVDSCEFVAILLFIVLILFFFLGKSL